MDARALAIFTARFPGFCFIVMRRSRSGDPTPGSAEL